MSEASLSDRESAVWRALTLMGRGLATATEKGLQRDAGISAPDFEILRALSEADGSRARASELGGMLSWEKSRISHHVTRMVGRGLVARDECEVDLRGTWVTITPEGRAALDRALPAYAEVVRSTLTGLLSEADAAAIGRAAVAVVRGMEPGACGVEVDRLERALTRAPA
jgi:DNA-binding MarR family transcriptional regulator